MRLNLSRRSGMAELMDDDRVAPAELAACLRDLARVNRWTLAYRPTLSWFSRLVAQCAPDRSLRVLDAGCGYGDMLRRLVRWARARGVPIEAIGIDRNPAAQSAAAAATPPDLPIRYEVADLFTFAPEKPFDVIVSSLVAHHLTDQELVRFLCWMDERAVLGWFVNDLHRHVLSYRLVRAVFPLLRLHPLVVHDGPVSIARAFTHDDWRRLLDAAGLDRGDVTVERYFPFRFGVGCIRPLRA